MQLTDKATLSEPRMTADGYLVADARIARVGIQVYAGSEVGKPEMAQVRVYRPEAEVFAADALASFAHRPVTNDHPPEAVSAKNWRKFSVGMTGDEVARDGAFVRIPMVLMDAGAIDAVKNGKRELSCGYTCDLKFEAGTTPSGEPYDAVQTAIRGNHLAIVSAGRAGSDCRIGDEAEKEAKMALKTVTVDGIPIEVTDQGATVIATLQQRLADAATASAAADAKHATTLAAKDAELAKKDATIDDLKAKVVDAAALDKLVADRAALVTVAKAIAKDAKLDGLSDADIRKAVVIAKLGDAAVKDKPQAYIDARFDILAEDAAKSTDPVRDALGAGLVTNADADKSVTDARAKMLQDMMSAHIPAQAN